MRVAMNEENKNKEEQDTDAQPEEQGVPSEDQLSQADKIIRERWSVGIPKEYTELAAHYRRLAQDPEFIKNFVNKIVKEMGD